MGILDSVPPGIYVKIWKTIGELKGGLLKWMFMVYVNYMAEGMNSYMSMFANDATLLRK